MSMGSLFGLLHNETVPLSGELLLPILRDVAKGLRFLHTAVPPVGKRRSFQCTRNAHFMCFMISSSVLSNDPSPRRSKERQHSC